MRPLRQLQIAATTVAAAAVGLMTMATRRERRERVKLVPGDIAPDFELPGSDGRNYRLSDYRGRSAVVIAWFPKAFTGGCTNECESLRRGSSSIGRFHARLFGASVDRLEANRRFARALGIDYPILSDVEKTVARAYGVLGPSGFPDRWTFYIGLDGRIAEIDRHVRTSSHGEDVAARLEELGVPRQAPRPVISS